MIWTTYDMDHIWYVLKLELGPNLWNMSLYWNELLIEILPWYKMERRPAWCCWPIEHLEHFFFDLAPCCHPISTLSACFRLKSFISLLNHWNYYVMMSHHWWCYLSYSPSFSYGPKQSKIKLMSGLLR